MTPLEPLEAVKKGGSGVSYSGKGPQNPGHIMRNRPFPGMFLDPIVTFQTAF